MKKYFMTVATVALFAIGFAASDDSEVAEKLVGNYVVQDSKGTTWYFVFTDNNKVTVKSKGMSDDDMYFGNWSAQIGGGWLCSLSFLSFHAGNPPIEFPNGCISSNGETIEVSDEGWIYNGSDNLKAKNPSARLKMTKQ